MTYTPAPLSALRARLPRFALVDDAIVETALTDALRWVGQHWTTEDDYQLGQIYYAAHVLTLDGHGGGVEAQLASEGLSNAQTVRSGQLQVTFQSPASSGSEGVLPGTLGKTIYGQRYYEIAFKNVRGPLVAKA